MDAAIESKMARFEALLQWFESADDPWFEEKRGHRLRELRGMQRDCCPCRPLGYTEGLRCNTEQQLQRVLGLLRRSSLLSPYTAMGMHRTVGRRTAFVAARHVEGCACAAPPPAQQGWIEWLQSQLGVGTQRVLDGSVV